MGNLQQWWLGAGSWGGSTGGSSWGTVGPLVIVRCAYPAIFGYDLHLAAGAVVQMWWVRIPHIFLLPSMMAEPLACGAFDVRKVAVPQ